MHIPRRPFHQRKASGAARIFKIITNIKRFRLLLPPLHTFTPLKYILRILDKTRTPTPQQKYACSVTKYPGSSIISRHIERPAYKTLFWLFRQRQGTNPDCSRNYVCMKESVKGFVELFRVDFLPSYWCGCCDIAGLLVRLEDDHYATARIQLLAALFSASSLESCITITPAIYPAGAIHISDGHLHYLACITSRPASYCTTTS